MPTTMESLRRTRHLARLLLACFAVALGVAMLSPLVHAGGMERVCSATDGPRWVAKGGNDSATDGPRWVAKGGNDSATDARAHGLECALCLPSMLPPATVQALAAPRELAPCAAPAPRQAHVPPLSRAPFPPRAPPVRA